MKIPSPVIVSGIEDSNAGSGPEQQIATLPTTPGLFAVRVDGRVTHLSAAPNLQRRVMRTVARLARFSGPDERHSIAIDCWESASKLESSLLLYQLAKQFFPREYLQRVHLRMPWFVALLTRDQFPRLLVTNRIPAGCEPVIGPFARREMAQLYEQEVQSACLLRRCTEVLDPHPEHPGCIYGEMKQCLRPCQCAVDATRYLAEAADVAIQLRDQGGKTIREKTRLRDEAIAEMDFEVAAQLHKQLERLKSARSARDSVIATIDTFHGVALVREAKSDAVQLLPMVQGRWCEPVRLDLTNDAAQSHTVEAMLRQVLDPARLEEESRAGDRLEDLALFARWYYSSWHEGVWVPFTRLDEPPYRKMARSVQTLRKDAPAVNA